MLIRRAYLGDYKSLSRIRDKYVLKPESIDKIKSKEDYSKDGFLLDDYPERIFIDDLNKIFIIAESDSKLIGYIRIENTFDEDFLKIEGQGNIIWTKPKYKEIYYKKPHFEIGVILVDSEGRGKGVGGKLLDYAYASILTETPWLNDEFTIFSFVMVEPVCNETSLKFHEKNGFIQVAELKPCNLHGFEGYKSVLLAKEVSRSKFKKWE